MENVMSKKVVFQNSGILKESLVIALRFTCMALFIYTAYAKIIDHERFLNGLLRVHIINGLAVYVSYMVPIFEIIIALLILIPQTARLGLYAFVGLMAIFTGYIVSVLIWEQKLPCHCGGAIEKLSWSQHIWFNLAYILAALFALWLIKTKKYILKN
ncbi:hypothetical protein ABIB50_001224 [Mucilaginibacter sp. UYCu711]|jgi:hypothetical protein